MYECIKSELAVNPPFFKAVKTGKRSQPASFGLATIRQPWYIICWYLYLSQFLQITGVLFLSLTMLKTKIKQILHLLGINRGQSQNLTEYYRVLGKLATE